MITCDHLVVKIQKLGFDFNIARVKTAYEFAALAHEGQKRFSGDPYIMHPLEVAYRLLDFHPDEDTLVAALLHDVSEDTEKTLDDIENLFGPGVRSLVRGMEKLSKVRSRVDEPEIENLRKMFLSFAADIRVVYIKLCDRWHNMETLNFVRPEKQRRIAKETMDIYVPIASRMGIYKIKAELEDLCFKYLNSDMYRLIHDQMEYYTKQNHNFIVKEQESLKKYLTKKGYNCQVTARLKNVYSIYKKLKKKGKSLVSDIYDIYALRVIVPDEYDNNLYQILGDIHRQWSPLANRFKDYVAVPKPNGYQSLHTTVVGIGFADFNRPVEIQIRTASMHTQAEFGAAAHWLYKYSENPELYKAQSCVGWIDELKTVEHSIKNNTEFIESLHMDMFNDRIFVLTPRGDVKDLPEGSTPIDFAYAVHTDVGNTCVMAKVNDSVVPLDHELRSGDVVEIIRKKDASPNQYWLSFVVTSEAKSKIKHFLKNLDPDKNFKEGRELINKYLESIGKPALDSDLLILKNFGNQTLNQKQRYQLLEEVATGKISVKNVIKSMYPLDKIAKSKPTPQVLDNDLTDAQLAKQILLDGEPLNVPVKFVSCCKIKFPNPIGGYVTRGAGITIHASNCKVFQNINEERKIKLSWKNAAESDMYVVDLSIELKDRVGMLKDIVEVISKFGVNILDVSLKPLTDKTKSLKLFSLAVSDYDQLVSLILKLNTIENVVKVSKIN